MEQKNDYLKMKEIFFKEHYMLRVRKWQTGMDLRECKKVAFHTVTNHPLIGCIRT